MRNIQGKIDILYSERSNRDRTGEVTITVYDDTSGLPLVEVVLTSEQFAQAALGRLSRAPVKEAYVTPFPDAIGKTKRMVSAKVALPKRIADSYDTQDADKWLRENVVPGDGWQISSNLGSRGFVNGGCAHFHFVTYIQPGQPTPEPSYVGEGVVFGRVEGGVT